MPLPAAFYTVSSLPYSQLVTVADFNAGTHGDGANQVWFKIQNAADIAFGQYDDSAVNMRVQLYESDATTLINDFNNETGWRRFELVGDYWVKVTKSAGGAIAADFTMHFDSLPMNPTIVSGDYFINDDDGGFTFGCVISPDGTIIGFIPDVPSGEIMCSTKQGYVLVADRFASAGSKLKLYAPDMTALSTFDTSTSLGAGLHPICTNDEDFYVFSRANYMLWRVDLTGASSLIHTFSAMTVNAIGVSRDASILYYTENGATTGVMSIQRFNLDTLTPMSVLYTLTDPTTDTIGFALTAVNGNPGEILVTSDDEVTTYYQNYTQNKSVLMRLSSTGTLLDSASISINPSTVGGYNHISFAPNSPSYLNVWRFVTDGDHAIIENRTVSGTIAATTSTLETFSVGSNRVGADTEMFGPSQSCGFATLVPSYLGSTPAGIEHNNSAECCASPGTEGSGVSAPGAGVERPVLASGAWTGQCEGGGTVPLIADLVDAENWSDS